MALNPIERGYGHKKLSKKTLDQLSTPDGFAELYLGMKLYPKQKAALRAIMPEGARVSFASCNEGGKTAIVETAAILWHMFMFPCGIVDATSGSYRQLEDQLMPSLHSFKEKFGPWKWRAEPRIGTEMEGRCKGGFFRGFSTDQMGRAEGDHEDLPEAPLLYCIDEAKSCQDWLHGVVEGRVRPTRLLLLSSHGYAEGWFYKSHTSLSSDYTCITQTAEECPHIKQEAIDKVRRTWAGCPDFANSVLGHGFMPLVEDAVINYKALDSCINDPPPFKPGEKAAFCDFAWSNDGDENTMAYRDGNKITLEAAFNCDNLHGICDRFVAEFVRLGLHGHQIGGDEGSGGKMIMDELERRGWKLNRLNNGASAVDSDHYVNIASELWFQAATYITNKAFIFPNDSEARAQMVNRKRVPNNKGKLAIESKRDMKSRGVPSPDRADVLISVCMAVGGLSTGACEWALPVAVGGYQAIGN